MLKAYRFYADGHYVIAETDDGEEHGEAFTLSQSGWVRYEDAKALELRIAELEQQLKTPEQKRAEFEVECG